MTTNSVSEWTGLITGLEAALELGATEIVVRLDSELVIKQLKGIYRVKHMKPSSSRATATTVWWLVFPHAGR